MARLAILADYREENWPSMDLVAEMLARHAGRMPGIEATVCRPEFRHLAGPIMGRRGFNTDRLINRMWRYPRFAGKLRGKFEFFHAADHSYSQCLLPLTAERTGVFCHDLDTFRCLVDPQRDPRPKWFRQMARRILRGFQSSRIVFYATDVVRAEIERFAVADPAKLVHAPFGFAEEFSPEAPQLESFGSLPERFILNVGSCVPRKRTDLLLRGFTAIAAEVPHIRLVQVGGEWSETDLKLLAAIPSGRVVQLRGLTRQQLAELYRRAELVVQPSEAEGFGLPVLEALACGTAVVASDIPVFREVAGESIDYFAAGDFEKMAQVILEILQRRRASPSKQDRLARAARFSWEAHAAAIVRAYQAL